MSTEQNVSLGSKAAVRTETVYEFSFQMFKRVFRFPHTMNASINRHRGQDNMAAAVGRYYGEGGRASKRQKTEDGGMSTVRLFLWSESLKCCFAEMFHVLLF